MGQFAVAEVIVPRLMPPISAALELLDLFGSGLLVPGLLDLAQPDDATFALLLLNPLAAPLFLFADHP